MNCVIARSRSVVIAITASGSNETSGETSMGRGPILGAIFKFGCFSFWKDFLLNIICSYSSNFNMFLVFTNSDIAHLFLSLDLRKNLILLTMFARLTCLVYYVGC